MIFRGGTFYLTTHDYVVILCVPPTFSLAPPWRTDTPKKIFIAHRPADVVFHDEILSTQDFPAAAATTQIIAAP
jgi:hypothetical protein